MCTCVTAGIVIDALIKKEEMWSTQEESVSKSVHLYWNHIGVN